MSKRPYQLPGLTQLASFEAASRNMSFKDAAQELNVTSSAISHQIRALEDDLHTQLFDRTHRQIALTESGEELYSRLRIAFTEIAETAEKIRAMGEQSTVTIGATTAVSSLWLTPRISRFLRENNDIRIHQSLNDQPSRSDENSQLRIVYGEGDYGKKDVVQIFHDELVPVASPSFAKRYGKPSLPGLARLPLIQLESDEVRWTKWKNWFQDLDYLGDINFSQKVNNYLLALQSAREGSGVVLGWRNLIKPMIDRGELVVLTEYSVPASDAFYLVSWPEDRLNPSAKLFRDWLLNPIQLDMKFL